MGITDGTLTSLAFCWTIERRDGAGLALTSHDSDLFICGRRYRSQPGMVPAAIERKLGIGEADGEIAGAITSAALTEADLNAGRWDGAHIRLTAIDWSDPEAETIALMDGELADIESDGSAFRAGLRGASAVLSRPVCPETSSECRAELGGRKCRVDMAGRRAVVAVMNEGADGIRLDRELSSEFLWGHARFLSGANSGLTNVVVAIAGDRITLRDPPYAAIAPGDRLHLSHGCDKMFATCRDRFANAGNFRGEPHLPGNDLLTRFPGA